MSNAEPVPSSASDPQPAAAPIDPSTYGIALADAVQAAMPTFVAGLLQDRATAVPTPDTSATVSAEVAKLGTTVTSSVDQALRAFLTSDVDTQRTTPLTIIRNHMAPVTEFLQSLNCEHATRDPFDESAFPADVFAVGPHAWADFGEAVHEAGLRWGAAKAMAHRQRHRLQ